MEMDLEVWHKMELDGQGQDRCRPTITNLWPKAKLEATITGGWTTLSQ